MAKKVHVDWKSGGSDDYTGVSRIEEDHHFEHVTGWRLYDADGTLMVSIKNDITSFVEVTEEK